MKCQYVGSISNRGCNNDAERGTRFCHEHRVQGPDNELGNRLTCGCVTVFVILFILVSLGLCGSGP